jgi:hypothetical protein
MWVFLALQNFLMGQKLHSITYHEDHDVLNKNLMPDPDPSSAGQDTSGMFTVYMFGRSWNASNTHKLLL